MPSPWAKGRTGHEVMPTPPWLRVFGSLCIPYHSPLTSGASAGLFMWPHDPAPHTKRRAISAKGDYRARFGFG
jgi:hypothetical protein